MSIIVSKKRNNIVYEFFQGRFNLIKVPKNPKHNNFVICCDYGDWSGFRVLDDCLAQEAEIAKYVIRNPSAHYWIEERL